MRTQRKLLKGKQGEDMEALALELSEDSGVEGNKGFLKSILLR